MWRRGLSPLFRLVDEWVVAPHWRAHALARDDVPPDGNTHSKLWTPRWPASAYYAVLCVVVWAGASALASPAAAAAAPASLRALALIMLLVNVGFAFTNWVTSARRTCFVGRHGDYRDIAVVNVCSAIVAWWCEPQLFVDAAPAASTPPGYGVAADGASVGRGWPDDALGVHDPDTPWWHRLPGAALLPTATREVVATIGDTVVGDAGQMAPTLWLLLGFTIGTHIAYLVRAGVFDRSLSGKDLVESNAAGLLGIVARIVIILYFATDHIMWTIDNGVWVQRLALYGLVYAAFILVTRHMRDRYYFHWHHWAAGVMLAPFSVNNSVPLSLVLLGLVLGQHVDGASRFSCAPLWHRHAKYAGPGYRYG